MGYKLNQEKFEAQMVLGSTRFPDAPLKGYVEAYFRMLSAIGIRNSAAHDIGVDFESYSIKHYAVMLGVEKVTGQMSSGQNLQGGQECRFSIRNFGDPDETGEEVAVRCYTALEYDCIVELKAGSCTVLN